MKEGRSEGGREGRREGGKEGRREGGKEGRREGGKEGRREGGKKEEAPYFETVFCAQVSIVFFAPPLMTTLEAGLSFLAEEGALSRLSLLPMRLPEAAC